MICMHPLTKSQNEILPCVQVRFASGSYIDEFGRNSVVFLAAESPNILTGIEVMVKHASHS